MEPLTADDVRRALGDRIEVIVADECRIDLQPVGRLLASVIDEYEESQYRSFASALGIVDDESEPERWITLPRVDYDKMKAQVDRLPELMRDHSRPECWSAEDERQYRRWALNMGLE